MCATRAKDGGFSSHEFRMYFPVTKLCIFPAGSRE
nr:MAG TPA: hypothetical protein [Caudoviricetes sp.]